MALQHAQAIAIFQRADALGQGSSSLPHIIASALLSLANLWQMSVFFSSVFFVILDCHFIILIPIFLGFSFPYFFVNCLLSFFLWVVSTCAFICHVLLMHGFPSLIFLYGVFLLLQFVQGDGSCNRQMTQHQL